VFVVGDTASYEQNGKPLPGVAQVAMQGGNYVASVISHRVKGKELNKPFTYHDKGNLATVGRSFAIVDIGNIRLTGFFAWLMWLALHIYFMVGFRNRLVAIFQWSWTYFTYSRGARLITFENEHEP
jgi:NADH dehydrogenase